MSLSNITLLVSYSITTVKRKQIEKILHNWISSMCKMPKATKGCKKTATRGSIYDGTGLFWSIHCLENISWNNGLTKVQLQFYNAFSSILQLLDRPLMYTKHIETSFSFKPYCLLVVNAKKSASRSTIK